MAASPPGRPKAVSYTHLDVYKRQVVAGTSEAFKNVIASDVKKWKNVAADAKIQLDQ